jgi:membrane fusion protein, multidrug efflux system
VFFRLRRSGKKEKFMQESNSSSLTRSLVCGALFAIILIGCGQSKGGGAPGAGGPPPAPQVTVAPSVQRQIQEFDEFTGRLEATETVDVRPRVSGTIDRVHFKEGQLIRKGDLLFTIDARPFRAELARAEAQLAAAQTQSELAKTEFARAQKLLEIKAISRQEFD